MPVQADGNWVFNLNLESSSSHSENFRAIGDCAEVAGWSIEHSSNGTTVVTGSRLSNANWDASTSAWEEWHDPGGHRALIIQRRASVFQANVWLTQTGTLPLTGTSAGGPTTPPSAGSFQAALVATSVWTTTVASSRVHIAFGSAPCSGTNVYPFYIVGATKASTSIPGFYALLGTETPEPALDREPWVLMDTPFDNQPSGWYRAANVGGPQSFIVNGMAVDNTTIVGAAGQSPYSGNRYLVPAFVYDSAGDAQVKGRIFDYYRTNLSTVGDTVGLTVSGSCWHLYSTSGGVVLRWQPGLTPDWS